MTLFAVSWVSSMQAGGSAEPITALNYHCVKALVSKNLSNYLACELPCTFLILF